MKCNQCLHYNACMHLIVTEHEELIECEHFKDKSKWVELTCKLSDTIYDRFCMQWQINKIEFLVVDGKERYLFRCGHKGTDDYCCLFDDEYFLSKEAAEQALEV